MALTLSKTNIVTGQTIQASQITQSVDALTGAVAYDITISGSLLLTGSVDSLNGYTGSLLGTASFATSASRAITASFAVSASRAVTASFALNATSPFPFNGNAVITGSLNVTSAITSSAITSSNIDIADTANIIKILNMGVSGTANKDLKIDASSATLKGSNFTPASINTPDDWLVIQYTDYSSTPRTGYIPIYYTPA